MNAIVEEKPEQRSMRYAVGDIVPFVHCKWSELLGGPGSRPYLTDTALYCPWKPEVTLTNLSVVMLKCVVHHRVAGEWDDKKQYDGFIFEKVDDPKSRWLNQYPRASYGQLDDSGDRRVTLDYIGAGLTVDQYIALEDNMHGMANMHDGLHFLPNIRRGQLGIAESAQWQSPLKERAISALVEYEAKVQALMEKATGKKLKLMQVKYPASESRKEFVMNWFDVVFEGDPAWELDEWVDPENHRTLIKPVETEV